MPTVIELCAGGGGQTLGLHNAGFSHLAAVDNDPDACETLRHNFGSSIVHEADIHTWDTPPRTDLLAAGIPCPPFSAAGKKLGADDDRDLFPRLLQLTRDIEPTAILVENVKGLLTPRFADYRADITAQFLNLGYHLRWNLFDAADYGVPQRRQRTIIIGLQEPHIDRYTDPEPVGPPPTVGDTLKASMESDGWDASRWAATANQVAPTIVGGSKKHGGADLGPSGTKQAWAKLGVNGRSLADRPPEPDFDGDPRLTVQQVALLQGFPPTWRFTGSKSAAYRQVGNAFPPPVAAAIGAQIAAAIS